MNNEETILEKQNEVLLKLFIPSGVLTYRYKMDDVEGKEKEEKRFLNDVKFCLEKNHQFSVSRIHPSL